MLTASIIEPTSPCRLRQGGARRDAPCEPPRAVSCSPTSRRGRETCAGLNCCARGTSWVAPLRELSSAGALGRVELDRAGTTRPRPNTALRGGFSPHRRRRGMCWTSARRLRPRCTTHTGLSAKDASRSLIRCISLCFPIYFAPFQRRHDMKSGSTPNKPVTSSTTARITPPHRSAIDTRARYRGPTAGNTGDRSGGAESH